MLTSWLKWQERRPPPYSRFRVIDTDEHCSPSGSIRAHLAELVRAARLAPDFIEAAATELGWPRVRSLAAAMGPRLVRMRRGQFGEAIACAMLEQWHGYLIPVHKLRFLISPDQSLPGTDALALRVNRAGRIVEVVFMESKLRTIRAVNVPLQGYEQLQTEYSTRANEILMFVAQRLFESHNPLFTAFMAYMRSQGQEGVDRFRLTLVWEEGNWDNDALQMIEEHEPPLDGTGVDVVTIDNLGALIEDVYLQAGAEVDDAED